MRTFRVSGICFIPVRATMIVRAASADSAVRQAKRNFRGSRKAAAIESSTEDTAAAFGWKPSVDDEEGLER